MTLTAGTRVAALAKDYDDINRQDVVFPALAVVESVSEENGTVSVVFDGDGVKAVLPLRDVKTLEEFSEWLRDRLDTDQYRLHRWAYREWPGAEGIWKRDGCRVGQPDYWRPIFLLPKETAPFELPEGGVYVAETGWLHGEDREMDEDSVYDIVYVISEDEIFPLDAEVNETC